jgi:hypothetical protein
MKSAVLPSFWKAYDSLDEQTKRRAQRAYQLWADDPFYPSLHFKCINSQENIWSARVTLAIRAVGVMDDDTVTWFWIGNHDDYERFFG